jgi:hypothetical protein
VEAMLEQCVKEIIFSELSFKTAVYCTKIINLYYMQV